MLTKQKEQEVIDFNQKEALLVAERKKQEVRIYFTFFQKQRQIQEERQLMMRVQNEITSDRLNKAAQKQQIIERNQKDLLDYMNYNQKSELSKYKKNSKLAELKTFKIGSNNNEDYLHNAGNSVMNNNSITPMKSNFQDNFMRNDTKELINKINHTGVAENMYNYNTNMLNNPHRSNNNKPDYEYYKGNLEELHEKNRNDVQYNQGYNMSVGGGHNHQRSMIQNDGGLGQIQYPSINRQGQGNYLTPNSMMNNNYNTNENTGNYYPPIMNHNQELPQIGGGLNNQNNINMNGYPLPPQINPNQGFSNNYQSIVNNQPKFINSFEGQGQNKPDVFENYMQDSHHSKSKNFNRNYSQINFCGGNNNTNEVNKDFDSERFTKKETYKLKKQKEIQINPCKYLIINTI